MRRAAACAALAALAVCAAARPDRAVSVGVGVGARAYMENVAGFPGWRGELVGASSRRAPEKPRVEAAVAGADALATVQKATHPTPVAVATTAAAADALDAAAAPARAQAAARALAAATAAAAASDNAPAWAGHKAVVSWSPRAFKLTGFLSDDECDYLIHTAAPSMAVSTVVDTDTGESMPSSVRTSTGMFMERAADPVVASLERRIALATDLPAVNGEGMQVLRYAPDGAGGGQRYEAHHDFFNDAVNVKPENGGQRIGGWRVGGACGRTRRPRADPTTPPCAPSPPVPATVLMYLTTPAAGGETVFPHAADKVQGPGWSDCAREGMSFKPARGDALVFYSLHPDGERDWRSLHGSCPVTSGVKWSATKVGAGGRARGARRADARPPTPPPPPLSSGCT